jgi:hypothetical protein
MNLVDDASQRVPGRLDGVAPADGDVAVQDLLEGLDGSWFLLPRLERQVGWL